MSVGAVNKETGGRIPAAGNYLDKVGTLASLHTTAKNNAVSAINEVTDAVSAITDGQNIDSFADVETALSGKQATLTFDDTPTDGSNNPVKSNGIYDALALKQNATDNNLDTTAKTIVGAINEHEGDITSLKSGLTTLDTEVNGDATVYPYADVITIEDAVPANLADCSVKIEPVQDLHGQSAPYVGGAGKNKLPLVLADIKAANTDGTWNGNVYTINNGTFTVYTDDGGNVTKIVANGTFSIRATLRLRTSNDNYALTPGSYIVSKGFTNSNVGIAVETFNGTTWVSRLTASTSTDNVSFTVDYDGYDRLYVYLEVTATSSAVNETFYPMIRLATETDATFAPYSNICPISGHTQASVQRDGRNLWNGEVFKSGKAIDNTGAEISANNYSLFKYVLPVGNYTVSFADSDKTSEIKIARVGVFNSDDSVANVVSTNNYTSESGRLSLSFSVTDKTQYAIVSLRAVSVVDVQIEYGSSATDYESYQGKTYTIALGSTIYGGTVDFDSGVMTVTHKYIDLGDYTWSYNGNNQFYTSGINDFAKDPLVGANEFAKYCICEKYKVAKSVQSDAYLALYYNTSYSGYRCFVLNDPNTTEMGYGSEFKTYITGTHICYELNDESKFTVQLTPEQIQLLKGTNTLYASTGQISVTVNGVSGAIGSLTEQVNELASGKQDKTDYALNTTAKTIVGGINEVNTKMQRWGKVNTSTASKWYHIGYIAKSSLGFQKHRFIIAFNGAHIKLVTLRCTPTDGYDNNDTEIAQIYGTANYFGLIVSDDKLRVDLYITPGSLAGAQTYQILTEGGEAPSVIFNDPVLTDLTDADMTKVG